jgi:hypothetical protein
MAQPPSPFAPDTNLFGAHMLAACEAYGIPAAARMDILKREWHNFRRFVEWVNSGQDQREWEIIKAREKAQADREAAVAAADAAGEERRRQERVAAYNAR